MRGGGKSFRRKWLRFHLIPVILHLLFWGTVKGQQQFSCYPCDNRINPVVQCESAMDPFRSRPCGPSAKGCAILFEYDNPNRPLNQRKPKWTLRGCRYDGQLACIDGTGPGGGGLRSGRAGTEDDLISAIGKTLTLELEGVFQSSSRSGGNCDARQLMSEGEAVHWPANPPGKRLIKTYKDYKAFVDCRVNIRKMVGSVDGVDQGSESQFLSLHFRNNFKPPTFGYYFCAWDNCNGESFTKGFVGPPPPPTTTTTTTTTTTPTTTTTTPTTTTTTPTTTTTTPTTTTTTPTTTTTTPTTTTTTPTTTTTTPTTTTTTPTTTTTTPTTTTTTPTTTTTTPTTTTTTPTTTTTTPTTTTTTPTTTTPTPTTTTTTTPTTTTTTPTTTTTTPTTTTTTPTTTSTTPTPPTAPTTPRQRRARTLPTRNPDWTWRTDDYDDKDCDCVGCDDSSAWLIPNKSFLILSLIVSLTAKIMIKQL